MNSLFIYRIARKTLFKTCCHAMHTPTPQARVEKEVWVMPSTDIVAHSRTAAAVAEWRVEPVVGSDQIALTIYLSELQELTFVLEAEDCADLAKVLAR